MGDRVPLKIISSASKRGFSGGANRTCLPVQEKWDLGLIPGSGRSPGDGNDNPLQSSCLENPMDREAWWATVHWVARVRHDWNDLAHTHAMERAVGDFFTPTLLLLQVWADLGIPIPLISGYPRTDRSQPICAYKTWEEPSFNLLERSYT